MQNGHLRCACESPSDWWPFNDFIILVANQIIWCWGENRRGLWLQFWALAHASLCDPAPVTSAMFDSGPHLASKVVLEAGWIVSCVCTVQIRDGEITASTLSCCCNDKHNFRKEAALITTGGNNNCKSKTNDQWKMVIQFLNSAVWALLGHSPMPFSVSLSAVLPLMNLFFFLPKDYFPVIHIVLFSLGSLNISLFPLWSPQTNRKL